MSDIQIYNIIRIKMYRILLGLPKSAKRLFKKNKAKYWDKTTNLPKLDKFIEDYDY